jgi:hypothetical protein
MTSKHRSPRVAPGRRLGYHGRSMQTRLYLILGAALVAAAGPVLSGASLSRAATATATVNAVAKLTLSATTLTFPDADPDSMPSIPAAGGAITITAKARTTIGSTVTLVVKAADDLRSGLDTILATSIGWTASGTGFVPGTLSKTAAQTVASWTSSGSWTGTQSYTLQNSWNYATGTYSTTLTYTLTAP